MGTISPDTNYFRAELKKKAKTTTRRVLNMCIQNIVSHVQYYENFMHN
jgi:hypothetical protein